MAGNIHRAAMSPPRDRPDSEHAFGPLLGQQPASVTTSKNQTAPQVLGGATGRAAILGGLPAMPLADAEKTAQMVQQQLMPHATAAMGGDQIRQTRVIFTTRGEDLVKRILTLSGQPALPDLLVANPASPTPVGQQIYDKLHQAGLRPCFSVQLALTRPPARSVQCGDITFVSIELPARFSITGAVEMGVHDWLQAIVPDQSCNYA